MMAEGPLMVEIQGKDTQLRIGDPKTGQQVTWTVRSPLR